MSKLTSTTLLLAGSALVLALACKTSQPDTSRVIANVGGEKITEAECGPSRRTPRKHRPS